MFVLHLFGGEPSSYDPARQQPLLEKNYNFPTSEAPVELPEHVAPAVRGGPVFNAPSSPLKDRFVCDYSAMDPEWQPCSSELDRGCWLNNTKTGERYDINTNYEVKWPQGTTRRIKLDISEMTLNADGVPVKGQVFNRKYPGPWVQACWGDDLEVTVTNSLPRYNGSTIHWHGVRQLNSFQYDGVNAISQCPIAPGESFVYKFKATQYGSTWYHSHYSLQVRHLRSRYS